MSHYIKAMTADRRLCMLRLLNESNGSANERVLASGLEMLGHTRQSQSAVREDTKFLEENGLIKIDWFADFQVCKITKRGVEVAEGRIEVEGVKKPSIGV